jgi:hypothetical protein
MFEFVKDNPKVLEYLPIEKEWKRLPRGWIIKVIMSVVPA